MTVPPVASVSAAHEEVADAARLAARFAHPDKYPPIFRAAVSATATSAVAAELAGIGLDTWQDHIQRFARDVEASSLQIDSTLAPRLPFEPGDRIVVLGDSITDDLMSWGAHLQVYLDQHLGASDIRVINAGITGNTTQEAIARIDLVIAAAPTWVIQMLGTNDARLHGATRARMQSIEETRRNVVLLGDLIAAETRAKLVRLTPPPVIAADADAWEAFRQQLITWRAADVDEIAQVVREQPGIVVDVHRALREALPDEPGLMLPDGVHPSLAGQRRILEIVLGALVDEAPPLARRS